MNSLGTASMFSEITIRNLYQSAASHVGGPSLAFAYEADGSSPKHLLGATAGAVRDRDVTSADGKAYD